METKITELLFIDAVVPGLNMRPSIDTSATLNHFRTPSYRFAHALKCYKGHLEHNVDVALVGLKYKDGERPTYEEAVIEIVLEMSNYRFLEPHELLMFYRFLESENRKSPALAKGKTWREVSHVIPGFMLTESRAGWNEDEKPTVYSLDELPSDRINLCTRFVVTPHPSRAVQERHDAFPNRLGKKGFFG